MRGREPKFLPFPFGEGFFAAIKKTKHGKGNLVKKQEKVENLTSMENRKLNQIGEKDGGGKAVENKGE